MGAAELVQDPADALLAALDRPSKLGAWAARATSAAEARFRAMGPPLRRDEYWRFTNAATLSQVPAPEAALFDPGSKPVFADIDSVKLVFSDGVFRPDLSDTAALDACEISLLSDAMETDLHWAADVYGVLEARSQERVKRPFSALNTAKARAGVAIRVTGRAPKPISLRYLHEDVASDAAIHHVVKVEAGAELTLLESGPAAARFNKVLEVEIAEGGTFHHVRSQGRDHERRAMTATFVEVGAKATFKGFTMTANGVLTRNETIIDVVGDDAVAHVAGACVGEGDFHHDDTVYVTHDAVGCESRQVFKKVLKNGATGVFQGKILVQPDAQKTDGYQISQGLLLDDDSQFLAKPELEIYADDVACSHGSTCGSVDETSLFYLTSRGIPRKEAVNMLVLAFLAEAMEEIEDDRLAEVLIERLARWMDRHA